MKKLLLVSVTAMFAAMPMLAHADPVNSVTVPAAVTTTDLDLTAIATTGYVKGAYGEVRNAVNQIDSAITVPGTKVAGEGGEHITSGDGVAANLESLNAAIKDIESASGSVTANGTYVKTGQTISQNLTALDNAIGEVAANGAHITKSTGQDSKNVAQNLQQLDTAVVANDTAIALLNNTDNTVTGSVRNSIKTQAAGADFDNTTAQLGSGVDTIQEAIDAVDANVDNLDTRVGALTGLGTNVSDKTSIVNAIKSVADDLAASDNAATVAEGNYIGKAANNSTTVGGALTALDTQVKTNTDHIGTVTGLNGTNAKTNDNKEVNNLVTAINNVDAKVLPVYNTWNNGAALSATSDTTVALVNSNITYNVVPQ